MAGKPAVIRDAEIHPGMGKNSLFVTMSNGHSGVLFEYYPDEESVVPDDFIGLTRAHAMERADRCAHVESE